MLLRLGNVSAQRGECGGQLQEGGLGRGGGGPAPLSEQGVDLPRDAFKAFNAPGAGRDSWQQESVQNIFQSTLK